MEAVLGWLILLVGLLVSVALHELGHMLPAKRFGVKVSEYFVGFGRTVWSVKRGETEYGIKALPLGGFVKLQGEYDSAKNKGDYGAASFWQKTWYVTIPIVENLLEKSYIELLFLIINLFLFL